MTHVLIVAVMAFAALSAWFAHLFFRYVWPLIEECVRCRMARVEAADCRIELARLVARLDRLERDHPGERK